MTDGEIIRSAFPVSYKQPGERMMTITDGMTLRDWLAGVALQGILACPTKFSLGVEEHARYAYRCADAMIKVREKK